MPYLDVVWQKLWIQTTAFKLLMSLRVPNKKADVGAQNSERFTFENVHDIKKAISATKNTSVLAKALSALRTKLSVKSGDVVSPQDRRLLLAKLWMDSSPAAQDLFEVWAAVDDMSLRALVVSVSSSLISLFSHHLPDHTYGVPIIKTLLSPQWSRRLNSYLGGSNNELILVTLKLFYTISTFGSGRERKSAYEGFPWDNKSLSKLLYMRRRGKEAENEDVLERPDIRTYYVLFALSMVDRDTSASVKTTFLEQRRDVFTSIFKGFVQDPCSLVQTILQTCWEGVWSDPKIKRTTKLGLFNETTISHILKLYDRTVVEKSGGEHVPADVVHHFLLAICTHPGQGICFKDRGWYPRETEEDSAAGNDDQGVQRHKGAYTAKIYNKILANVLRTLKVNEDPRQQELALKITAACPELVAGYWSAASLTLEPRLSSKWIANIAFAGQVVSQTVPVSSFLLPGSSDMYNPTPPPLSIIMANVLPSVGTKALFTKGLQAVSTPLVQHCTALALAKCLRKLADVARVFKKVEEALEEDEEEGQWKRRRREVETEARRRVPEFHVIVAFSQQTQVASNTPKHTLLSESAQRLLWLYQECLPDVVAEVRFEVGKLVLNLVEGSFASLSENQEGSSESQLQVASTALQTVKHMHVLRLLSGSDQFGWAGKVASSSHTYFYVLLKTFCKSRVRALRTTLKVLLQNVLSESVLFQEDPDEVDLWLSALPFHLVHRGQGARSPDGTPLADEVEAVVTFLDDCAQRCLKTPYRYMEIMSDLVQASAADSHRDSFASPLLMTVLEQVLAKTGGKLMTPSDTLAVFSFVRRLLVVLAAKQEDAGYRCLVAVLDQLDNGVLDGESFLDHPDIQFGVRRELSITRACLFHLRGETRHFVIEGQSDETIRAFVDRVERMSIPSSESDRMARASEIVDWLRLVDSKPSPSDISRLAFVVRRLYEPALLAFITHLHPSDGCLWRSDILKPLPDWPLVEGTFDWLYFHCTLPQFQDRHVREILLDALYARPATLARLENATRLITHGIAVATDRDDLMATLLSLSSDVLARARGVLDEKDRRRLKATVLQRDTIQGLCVSSDLSKNTSRAIQQLIAVSFDPVDIEDQALLSPVGSHWAEILTKSLSSGRFDGINHVRPWVKFMNTEALLAVVDLIRTSSRRRTTGIREVLEDILCALRCRTGQGSIPKISVRTLLELQDVLPGSTVLEEMLSATLASHLPFGLDGHIADTHGKPLSTVLSRVEPIVMHDLPADLISRVLEKESWTESTATVVVVLLYSSPTALPRYVTWLNSRRWTQLHVRVLATTLSAFLDCIALRSDDLSNVDENILRDLMDRLFMGERRQDASCTRELECISKIVTLSGTRNDRLASALQAHVQGIPLMDRASETTFLARQLLGVSGCDALVTDIVDRALQWAVRRLSDDVASAEDAIMALENLQIVAMGQETLKSHLVEPLMTVLVQRHLSDTRMLDLAVTLVKRTPLKPVVVNRILQQVLQHSHFAAVCGKHGNLLQRDRATRLLETLFRLHPSNTCQPSHVEALFQVYGGTMSSPDRRLLAIMRLFEAEKCTSLSPFFSRWSPSPDVHVSNVLEVVENFDPVYMLRTCLAFPLWRRFGEESVVVRDSAGDDLMYDPLIVVVLSAQMLVACPPTTGLGWVKVFRSNIVSLLVRCLSSKDPNTRETAACQIATLWERIQTSGMHETSQVVHVLRLLKNVMERPAHASDPPRRLPTYMTLILLHALRGIFYPSNFIYPRTARFLLQRPELDVTDVPMLFGMLYSSSDEWKKERGWMLKTLADGMTSTADWHVLRRRHTWDLVASLFQSSTADVAVRSSILELLTNLTCNARACTSLILDSSLLSWIEMQVGESPEEESITWVRILENVIVVADVAKLTRATGDGWCLSLCRSLVLLLRTGNAVVLESCAVVVLRLSRIPGVGHLALDRVLVRATECLVDLERTVCLNVGSGSAQNTPVALALPPHYHVRGGSNEDGQIRTTIETWGKSVEMLWECAMALERVTRAWAMLTPRLLVWRALVGERGSPVGEWARRAVVRELMAR